MPSCSSFEASSLHHHHHGVLGLSSNRVSVEGLAPPASPPPLSSASSTGSGIASEDLSSFPAGSPFPLAPGSSRPARRPGSLQRLYSCLPLFGEWRWVQRESQGVGGGAIGAVTATRKPQGLSSRTRARARGAKEHNAPRSFLFPPLPFPFSPFPGLGTPDDDGDLQQQLQLQHHVDNSGSQGLYSSKSVHVPPSAGAAAVVSDSNLPQPPNPGALATIASASFRSDRHDGGKSRSTSLIVNVSTQPPPPGAAAALLYPPIDVDLQLPPPPSSMTPSHSPAGPAPPAPGHASPAASSRPPFPSGRLLVGRSASIIRKSSTRRAVSRPQGRGGGPVGAGAEAEGPEAEEEDGEADNSEGDLLAYDSEPLAGADESTTDSGEDSTHGGDGGDGGGEGPPPFRRASRMTSLREGTVTIRPGSLSARLHHSSHDASGGLGALARLTLKDLPGFLQGSSVSL